MKSQEKEGAAGLWGEGQGEDKMRLVQADARSLGVSWDRARSLDFTPSTRRSH